ncbi:urease accessory protein UreF [Micromonospora avicenniae]|uniref:Urease accessory protein UreF n=1 Tax=Micromonospora avicenniae TaxID=1198245 RepID=A0A1N7BLX5_9ACTN|nr:urease accessory protein UreF [Micromonospora avicenniae]SIR52367.1 urease accessory protein [Micromonospora avicenniae]
MTPPGPTIPAVLRILQFGDSMFPVGAFAFSGGLEMAVQTGVVRNRAELAEFVRTVTHVAATGDGVALLHGHRGALAGDLDLVRRADEAVHLRKLSEESRTMTLRTGRKLAEAAARIVGDSMLDKRFRDAEADGVAVTYPVALGALFAGLGLSEQDAFAVHQYGVAATVLSAALRLMRIGHLDTQAILYEVNTTAAEEYQRVAVVGLDDMSAFAPVVDVLAAAHVQAHVRMFMN